MADCTTYHTEKYTCDKDVTTYKSWLYPENETATEDEINSASEKAQDKEYEYYSRFGYKRSDFPCMLKSAERLQKKPDAAPDPSPEINECVPHDGGCPGSLPDDKKGDHPTFALYPPTDHTPILSNKVIVPGATMTRKFTFTCPAPNIVQIVNKAEKALEKYQKIIDDESGVEALKYVNAGPPCVVGNTYIVGGSGIGIECGRLIQRIKRGAQNSINKIKPYLDSMEYAKLGILLSIPLLKGTKNVRVDGTVRVLRAKETSKKTTKYVTTYFCKGGDTRFCCDCYSSSSSSLGTVMSKETFNSFKNLINDIGL